MTTKEKLKPGAGGEAQESTTKKRRNSVWIEGYLKENLLQQVTINGVLTITGSITIATQDEYNAFKVRLFVPAKRDNKDNPTYADAVALLPANTVSIAQYLENTPTATYAIAASNATKVYASGYFEEYATEKDGKITSSATITARKAGIKSLGKPFAPKATFSCDMYIESLKDEVNPAEDNEPTGRMILVGLLPFYDGCMHRITFVTEEGQVTDYIRENYSVTQTANFEGSLRSVSKTVERTGAAASGWGTASNLAPKTIFFNERVITGGSGAAIDSEDDNGISLQEVKDGLLVRDERAKENGQKRNKKGGGNNGGSGDPAGDALAKAGVNKAAAVTNKDFDFNDF